MITIYICIYVSLYESTEEQKCLVPCELLNDITIIACIIIIVNKTRNANAIQSCSYVNTKNFIFFISLWGITLSKIIHLDPSKVLKGETENFSLLMGITIAY